MQPPRQPPKPIVFVIEHMEPFLFEWCLHQYLQMHLYLLNCSDCHLVIANAASFLNYEGPEAQENQLRVKQLKFVFASNPQRFRLMEESVTSKQLAGSSCMLDMRGPKQLSPDEHWDYIVFGGVLGDHPPRDRPAPVRKAFKDTRHLGSIQLATDTAVLVSRIILWNKVELGKIPFIVEPEIKGPNSKGLATCVQMEGFSYVSKQIDVNTGKISENMTKKERKQFYMSEGVRKLLLDQDLDQQFLM